MTMIHEGPLAEARCDECGATIRYTEVVDGMLRFHGRTVGYREPGEADSHLCVACSDEEDYEDAILHVHTYAVIDRETGRVLAVHEDPRGPTSAEYRALCAEMDSLQGDPALDCDFSRRAWVSVDGPCRVGDYVDVDEDGAATVRDT